MRGSLSLLSGPGRPRKQSTPKAKVPKRQSSNRLRNLSKEIDNETAIENQGSANLKPKILFSKITTDGDGVSVATLAARVSAQEYVSFSFKFIRPCLFDVIRNKSIKSTS